MNENIRKAIVPTHLNPELILEFLEAEDQEDLQFEPLSESEMRELNQLSDSIRESMPQMIEKFSACRSQKLDKKMGETVV